MAAVIVALPPVVCAGGQGLEVRFGSIEPPVVAQLDVTIAAPKSPTAPPVPIECSSLAWFADTLLITSDRHDNLLFAAAVSPQTVEPTAPQPVTILRNEQEMLLDCEALAVRRSGPDRGWIYAMCSLSNDRTELPLPRRRHMLRAAVSRGAEGDVVVTDPIVLDLNPLRERITNRFVEAGVQPYRTYYPDHVGPDKNTYRWGNVEGIAFAPASAEAALLLCGMRNPLVGRRAIICVVGGVDEAFDRRDAQHIELRDMFTLDLDGRGISDLSWDPVTRGYLISAADSNGPKLDNDTPFPPNTLRSALFWWSGHKADAPFLFADIPDMKIEGVCRLGDSPFIAIVSDEGDESEGRTARQSVVTVLEFTGVRQEVAAGPAGGR